jgi:hypothetical protein
MTRPQFRLSTLLWLTLAAACWFGGMRLERYRAHALFMARYERSRRFLQYLEPLPEDQIKLLEQLEKSAIWDESP